MQCKLRDNDTAFPNFVCERRLPRLADRIAGYTAARVAVAHSFMGIMIH